MSRLPSSEAELLQIIHSLQATIDVVHRRLCESRHGSAGERDSMIEMCIDDLRATKEPQ